MLEFQRGSRTAFEELYSRYRGPLYGFFRRRLDNPQRAEDLAQETFLVVIRGALRYGAPATPGPTHGDGEIVRSQYKAIFLILGNLRTSST